MKRSQSCFHGDNRATEQRNCAKFLFVFFLILELLNKSLQPYYYHHHHHFINSDSLDHCLHGPTKIKSQLELKPGSSCDSSCFIKVSVTEKVMLTVVNVCDISAANTHIPQVTLWQSRSVCLSIQARI